MAILLAQYLLNEGSGSVIADSSPNGNDITIDWGVYDDGQWTTMGNSGSSNGVNQPHRTAGLIGVLNPCPTIYEGLNQITMVLALEGVVGFSSGVRGVFIGTDGGNGNLMYGNSHTALRHDCRWNYEIDGSSTGPNASRGRYNYPGKSGFQIIIATFDFSSVYAGMDDHVKVYANNVLEVYGDPYGSPNNVALPADLSWAKFCLFNRPARNAGMIAKYGYVEIWDGILTAQERQEATDALLLNCDTAWAGAPPSTSVSFTSEPAASSITETTATGEATATSDAP